MQPRGVVEHGEGRGRRSKILMTPDLPEGDVSGNLVNHRGPSVTEAEGIGILLSPRPAEMAMFMAGKLLAEDVLSVHQNGAGRINISKGAIAELVTGFDDDGQPVTAGRLKNGEFVERDQSRGVDLGKFLGKASEVLN